MKFLVIRFSSIGDIVLATPAIRCLKLQVPDAEVHFLTKQSFKAVTEANPYIDRFYYFRDNLSELISELKKEQYDYIIDLHKNFRTLRIKTALRTKSLTYKKLTLRKFLLTKFHINLMPKRHITDRSLDTLKPLGVVNDGKGLDYFIPESAVVNAEDIPTSHAAGYIALVIGASYYTKKLPVEKLQELCRLIPYPVILVGGKEDDNEARQVALVDPVRIYNACGKFSLNESADLVRKAKLVISHDTGLQYVACAFNKPVLAIWGGTSPLLDVEPYYRSTPDAASYTNFIVPGLSCQPCSNYGTKTCPLGHFKCMREQDLQNMAAAALKELY
ncbi:glycosyltransferase family 9 protein [Sediminibacterium ginsengisoli]|uniref:Heptosyltransferase-2 n=1 Tax=Sediminibacterium ginsengisoli TaxID=413434 RepID=A0A1T4KAD1_9BACT|nr:glycosyltransferase family 9 protein [Sediminibacterium ginsengisoli]SJZ39418.1 heptosyltransferase-2 [Sediminibacterium ginsengisoli]